MTPRHTSRVTRLREKLEFFANGLAVVLATVTLVVAAVWWGWYAWGPKPVHIAPTPVESPVAVLRAAPLFGSAPITPTGKTEEVLVLDGELRLLGLISEDEGQGYAVFRIGQGVYIAQVGDDVAGQATLTRVEQNAIVLREPSGAERRVVLRSEEKNGKSAAAMATAESAAVGKTADSACVPSHFRGSVIRLNPELLQGALMQPEMFYALLEARGGGLIVRADNGHAAMLGLRAGDVLQSANGIALTRAEDVGATILKPLTVGQSVLLKGKRGDQARELLLVNASVCRS
ncbi:MAG: hypothetical protein LBE32_00860 [Burkholderiales bacterium]|jgi:hypothetical protein|nr:hypothetical protein [Burkholderiales bacterium]